MRTKKAPLGREALVNGLCIRNISQARPVSESRWLCAWKRL